MAISRIAIRCDGGGGQGAGHVGRCRPVAMAFREAGFETTFVGRFDGLAAWMADSSGLPMRDPSPGLPCGLDPTRFDAALVDIYGAPENQLCELAGQMPVATLGEAARCRAAGVLIDYHLDRDVSEDGPRLLAGPSYAPVDAAFSAIDHEYLDVGCVLITLGGSTSVRGYGEAVAETIAEIYPSARLLVAAGLPVPEGVRVERSEQRASLVDPARQADLAVTAAGVTTYELACAGVPFLALVVADNQVRVGQALDAAGLGPALDVRQGVDPRALRERLAQLRSIELRRALAATSRRLVDGRGAHRIVYGLATRWGFRP